MLLALLCTGSCVINASPVPDSTPATTTTHSDDDVQIVKYSNDNIGANGYNFAYVLINNILSAWLTIFWCFILFQLISTNSPHRTHWLLLSSWHTHAPTTASRPAMGCHAKKWLPWNMPGPYRSKAQSAGQGRMVYNIHLIMLPMSMASSHKAHICPWAQSQRLKC